ncbi:MAG: transposase [Gemmatimonadota bacterium]|nr:transposase [Gemmatimonadota bacterium]
MKAVLEEILEAEIAAHLGAAPGERTEARQGYRNGSYIRSYIRGLKTRVGALDITVPLFREGSFRPGVFERYRRMESPLEESPLS